MCVPNEAWENHHRYGNGHYDALPLNSSAGPCRKRHPIHMYDMSCKYAWHDVFIRVYIRMTLAYISYMHMMFPCVCLHTCVAWRFHMCDTTSAFVFYGWCIHVLCLIMWFFTGVFHLHPSVYTCIVSSSVILYWCLTSVFLRGVPVEKNVWLIRATCLTHIHITWRFYMWYIPSQVRRDWFSCTETSNPNDSVAHLNIWHDAFIW